ncbi:LOW QUALITY PROTEIN: copper chaperone for superoxide dismutase, chloroplastic/cytosolic [Argentina anserina]|uniref:LOW QUALITY PROTEIN: copper chaperone for superoxide dismutase, chloroplastic/cytosolic n=1 Tax=Argentina anserina TaxID=57926 RepID=UPI0021769437|nr:LOW QUALITY PROTEIN: copper chaperone for superoxide dismutase, chloroplastic/cytosolic [Potentilla anserina]
MAFLRSVATSGGTTLQPYQFGFLIPPLVATTTAIAASLLPAAISLSSSSSSQNLSFLFSSSPISNPMFLSTSLTNSPSALRMDEPTSEQKPSFQGDAVLPELMTEYMVDMNCEGCVKAVKNKIQVVGVRLLSYWIILEKLRVSDLIGRSVAVYGTAEESDSGVAAAVIARSAGVGENYKKLCTFDGTTIRESSDNDFVMSKV